MPVKRYPGGVTLVLPDRKPIRQPVRYTRDRTWWYCPRCSSAFDRDFKIGCFCTGRPGAEDGTYYATRLVKLPNQDVAEAAFLVGGFDAVYAIALQLKEEPGGA